ncbi:MAG: sulfatase-like hydrolase/transferase [Phycisphaera sp.]|nr:sulfatase-like hydrolase/transferase [Phycisphaera sp.]
MRLLFATAVLLIVLGCLVRTASAAATNRPNIVILYADDLGYGDVSCNNPDRGKLHTIHIDTLASQGMRFTDAHSSSGVCSPSRYTLLTGRYHWRTRLQKGIVGLWERPLIDADRLTVAGMLKQAGYRTAMIGKWHLGWDWPIDKNQHALLNGANGATPSDKQRAAWAEIFSKPIGGGPTARGFDTYFGTDVPNWPPYCFIENDHTVGIPNAFLPADQFRNHLASRQGPALEGWDLEEILPTLGDRACAMIKDAAAKDEPYFLYMPLTSPHTPLAVADPWKGKSGLGAYGDMVLETDAVIGRVLDAIEQSGEADHTLVVMTSDNGCAPYIGVAELEKQGHYPSGPLRGYKSDGWEGGHRVAFIVRWPGVVRAGSVCDQLVSQADLMRTFAEIVGVELPDTAGEDSVSLLPLLRGADKPVRETEISQSMGGLLTIRRGNWKLMVGQGSGGWTKGSDDQPGQLYNLAADVAEQSNLFNAEPKIAAEMTALLEKQVTEGRSTPGTPQKNDVEVKWNRMK